MFCPKCGFKNSQNAKFCAKCGSTINQQNFQAPRQNMNSQNFNQNSYSQGPGLKKIPYKKLKNNNDKVKIISISAALIAILILIAVLLIPRNNIIRINLTPKETVQNFFRDVDNIRNQKDLERVIKNYIAEDMDLSYFYDLLNKMEHSGLKHPEDIYKIVFFFKDCRISECEIDKDIADVEFSVQTRDFKKMAVKTITKLSKDDLNTDAILKKIANDKSMATKNFSFRLQKINGKWKILTADTFFNNIIGTDVADIIKWVLG